MKFVSYIAQGKPSYGLVDGESVIDKSRLGADAPATLRDAIAAGKLADFGKLKGQAPDFKLAELTFDLPIPNAGKIFCIGRNYRAYHEVQEHGKDPGYPSVFLRLPHSFAPHRQNMIKPKAGKEFDYEGELVAVIGKGGRHISREQALSHVAGYTIANEGTLREWLKMGTQNMPAKNFVRCGAMGPWMVTADEVSDPSKLHIKTRRNGTVVQDGGTDMMIFDLPYCIAHISKVMPLEPGDMISTGSPGGSAIESKEPQWLKAGETLDVEISGVGTLTIGVEDEA